MTRPSEKRTRPARQSRDKIRDIERLNPGKKVILADADADPEAGAVA